MHAPGIISTQNVSWRVKLLEAVSWGDICHRGYPVREPEASLRYSDIFVPVANALDQSNLLRTLH